MSIAQADYLRIIDGLNSGQLEAVSAPETSVLVVAGAGTGKTTASVRRIALFVASGVEPERVLAMTFGNKAARETKDRVSAFIPDGKRINSFTYHAFALREVIQPYQKNDYFKSLGFTGYLNLIDDKDYSTFLREARDQIPGLKEVIKLLEIKPKRIDGVLTFNRAFGKRADDFMANLLDTTVMLQQGKTAPLSTVVSFIDKIVSHLDNNKEPRADVIESLVNFTKNNPVVIDYLIGKLWQKYESVCIANNGIDFDDVLIFANRLISYSADVRRDLVEKFTHFALDEFQDSNKVQFQMLNQLFEAFAEFGKEPPNLFYVGDTRQAIFRFRGADAKYMTQMTTIQPNVRVCSLTENYRSSQQILTTANAHARTMDGHLTDGHLTSGTNALSSQPCYARYETADDEAKTIADQIKQKIDDGTPASEIAILYRTSAVKGDIERALAKNKVPFVVIGDASFYDSKEISDTISFLRMITRENDHLATSRVIDCFKGVTGFWYRNGVGQMTNMQFFEKQAHAFTAKSKPFQMLYEQLLPIKANAYKFSIRETCQALMQKRLDKMIKNGESVEGYTPEFLAEEIRQGHEMFKDDPAFVNHRKLISEHFDAVRVLWNTIYVPHIEHYIKTLGSENVDEQVHKRLSNINKLFDDVMQRVLYDIESTIDTVIEDLMMASDVSVDEENAVQILTLHKSKGLEYPYVYLPGLEQDIFFRENETDAERECDESQILYVGLTRARKELYCSSAAVRVVNGEYKANVEPLKFLTPEVLQTMNVVDHTVKVEVQYDASTSAWENLDSELDPSAAALLATLKL